MSETQETPKAPALHVLVRPEALKAAAVFASSSDPARPMLQGVHVEADGRLVATDGHRLIEVPPQSESPWPADAADYPVLPGSERFHAPGAEGVTIPTAALRGFKMPNGCARTPLPILRLARVAVNERTGEVTATDLDNTARAEFRPVEGGFPDWRKVVPKGEPVLVVGFNAALLAESLKALAALNSDDVAHTVRLTFHKGAQHFDKHGRYQGAITLENVDGSARGIVMPLLLPAPEPEKE